MLAGKFDGRQDVAGWWLAEKFDGVRAFWDGRVVHTRSWREVIAPSWFTAKLPRGVALDGELWGGYGTFQTVSELCRYFRADDVAWRKVTFQAFDWPTTDAIRFEERIAKLDRFGNEVVRPVAVRRCLGVADAVAELAAVVAGGGEGLMVKRPGHCYDFGRSSAWLKVKPAGVD